MKKTKLKKPIYDLLIAVLIALISFLPYIHDFNNFQGKAGFSGWSSLRISLFFIAIFLVAISGWVFAFINAKGKRYRFVIIAPIVMLVYQLFVYVLDKRDHAVNSVSVKVLVNFLVVFIIIILYFYLKRKDNADE